MSEGAGGKINSLRLAEAKLCRSGTAIISFRGIIPEEKVRKIRTLIKSGTLQ